MNGGKCRTCGRKIEWARTRKGHALPLDIEPVDGGNVELETAGGELVARVVTPEPGRVRRVSHFATCPDAVAHRRKRGRP